MPTICELYLLSKQNLVEIDHRRLPLVSSIFLRGDAFNINHVNCRGQKLLWLVLVCGQITSEFVSLSWWSNERWYRYILVSWAVLRLNNFKDTGIGLHRVMAQCRVGADVFLGSNKVGAGSEVSSRVRSLHVKLCNLMSFWWSRILHVCW